MPYRLLPRERTEMAHTRTGPSSLKSTGQRNRGKSSKVSNVTDFHTISHDPPMMREPTFFTKAVFSALFDGLLFILYVTCTILSDPALSVIVDEIRRQSINRNVNEACDDEVTVKEAADLPSSLRKAQRWLAIESMSCMPGAFGHHAGNPSSTPMSISRRRSNLYFSKSIPATPNFVDPEANKALRAHGFTPRDYFNISIRSIRGESPPFNGLDIDENNPFDLSMSIPDGQVSLGGLDLAPCMANADSSFTCCRQSTPGVPRKSARLAEKNKVQETPNFKQPKTFEYESPGLRRLNQRAAEVDAYTIAMLVMQAVILSDPSTGQHIAWMDAFPAHGKFCIARFEGRVHLSFSHSAICINRPCYAISDQLGFYSYCWLTTEFDCAKQPFDGG